jgi:hypothetical protein
MSLVKMIPMVYAGDFPQDVEDYAIDREWGIHYQGDTVCISDDGNPLAEWMKAEGFKFTSTYQYVAIQAT